MNTAIDLEALAETLEQTAQALRQAAAEKRKNTPAKPVIVHKPTELDQARAKRKLRDLGIDT